MLKKILSVVFLLVISVFSFSFSQKEVLDKFDSYVSDYQREAPESAKVNKLVRDLGYLSIYRLYKLQMVGSIEKKESTTTIADLLTKHMESLPAETFKGEDDRIAYSAFLAWVLSDISGKPFQVGTLNEMPAYLSTFNTFTNQVKSMTELVAREWIAYALGLVKKPPDAYPPKLEITNVFSQYNLKADAPSESESEVLTLSDERIVESLNRTVADLSQREYDVASLVEEEVKRFALQATLDISANLDPALMASARDLFQLWLYRSVGILDSAPHYPEEIPVNKAVPENLKVNLPAVEETQYEALVKFFNENPQSRQEAVEKLKIASQVLSIKEFTPVGLIEKDINDEVRKIVPIQMGILGQLRNKLSKDIVSKSEQEKNFWWLRFVAYGLLILLALFGLKSLKQYLVGILIVAETLYMFFISDVTRNLFDLSIYSIFVLPLFIFILLLTGFNLFNSKKRKKTTLLKLALLILIIVFPFMRLYNNVSEISMDNFEGFYDSIYYSSLKSDLFLAPESLISLQIRDLNSIVSSELNNLKRVLRVIIPNKLNNFASKAELSYSIDKNGRLRVNAPAFSDYMSVENQDTYSEELLGLAKDLNSFVRDSDRSRRNYSSALDNFIASSRRILTYAGEELRADFNDFVKTSITAKPELAVVYDDYLAQVEQVMEREPIAATVRAFRTPDFAALVLGLFLLAPVLFIVRKNLLSWIYLIIISSYLVLLLVRMKTLNLFVQAGSPELAMNIEPSISPLFLIVFAGIIVLSVLWLLSQKKGSVDE